MGPLDDNLIESLLVEKAKQICLVALGKGYEKNVFEIMKHLTICFISKKKQKATNRINLT